MDDPKFGFQTKVWKATTTYQKRPSGEWPSQNMDQRRAEKAWAVNGISIQIMTINIDLIQKLELRAAGILYGDLLRLQSGGRLTSQSGVLGLQM